MSRIMFIMGKSASGKDHIYQSLLEDKDLKLGTVTLYTTRPMREGEVDGREYFFSSMTRRLVSLRWLEKLSSSEPTILSLVYGNILPWMMGR